jgi:hypothetical protein
MQGITSASWLGSSRYWTLCRVSRHLRTHRRSSPEVSNFGEIGTQPGADLSPAANPALGERVLSRHRSRGHVRSTLYGTVPILIAFPSCHQGGSPLGFAGKR